MFSCKSDVLSKADLLYRVYSATPKALKHKQKQAKYGKIGAREMGDNPKKACIWDGGVNV